MTSDTLILLAIGGLIALLAESGILYAAVGMAGGEHIEERNSYLTAVFVTLLIGALGLGLRFLLQEDAIAPATAGWIIVPSWYLAVMFSYRLAPLRALLVLLVQTLLGVMIFFGLTYFNDLFRLYSGLSRIIPSGR